MSGDDICICIIFVAFMLWVIKIIASTGKIQKDPMPKPLTESQWEKSLPCNEHHHNSVDIASFESLNPASPFCAFHNFSSRRDE